jgi:hypothetical protein
MGKTRQSANLVSDNNIFVDVVNDRVGIGTENPTEKLTVVGVVSATSFYGDGNKLSNITATYSTSSEISTNVIGGISSVTQLQVSGISTFTNGPVFIGAATSTGTASQRLQVTGGAYVSGNIGVGVTNPAANTQVAIAGTLGISEVSGSGARTLLSSSGSGLVLNHNDNSNINIQSQGSNKFSYQFSSDSWVIPATTETKLIIGTGATTGTASQRLQVTGGAYVSGNIGVGVTNPSNTLTVVGTTDIQGAVETVSVASTYQNVVGTNIIVECDASKGTVFTHSLANGVVGIMSFRNFPATKNSITTFTVLFTQNSVGTANTTALTGIGTNIRLWPTGSSSGFTTSARVSSASTITLPTTANDVDIVTFAVHYNGAGTYTTTNYTVYATDTSSFRFGSIRP